MTARAPRRFWKALSDPTRREILDRLRDRPHTTGQLAASLPTLSRFAVMEHLSVLVDSDLVVVRPGLLGHRNGWPRRTLTGWGDATRPASERRSARTRGRSSTIATGGRLRVAGMPAGHDRDQREPEVPATVLDRTP